MKRFLFLFLSFPACISSAQTINFFNARFADTLSFVSAYGEYEMGSSCITNAFATDYRYNRYIDLKTKDEVKSKLKRNNNVFGSDDGGGLTYKSYFKKFLGITKVAYSVSLNYRAHFYSSFPRDLFELYFYGNYQKAGDTAYISNFDYRSMIYQQLQFGLSKNWGKNNKIIETGIGLSVLNGQYYLDIKTHSGTLYTQTDGEYIDMNLALESRQSDSTKTKFGATNGIGMSGDFYFKAGVKHNYWVMIQLNDAGFINWNNNSVITKLDTNYYFDGMHVSNLLDSIYVDIIDKDDFVNGFLQSEETKSFNRPLPSKIILSAEKFFMHEKIKVNAAIEERLNEKFYTRFFISGGIFFKNRFYAGINATAGGYTNQFNGGIDLGVDCGKGFMLNLSTSYLTGYLLPHSSTGQGAMGSLVKVF